MRPLTGFTLTGYLRAIGDLVFLTVIPLQILILAHTANEFDGEVTFRVALWAGVVIVSTLSIGIAYFVISTLTRLQDRFADELGRIRESRRPGHVKAALA